CAASLEWMLKNGTRLPRKAVPVSLVKSEASHRTRNWQLRQGEREGSPSRQRRAAFLPIATWRCEPAARVVRPVRVNVDGAASQPHRARFPWLSCSLSQPPGRGYPL